MARPAKEGLSYFPLDVDFFDDEKVLPVILKHGEEAGAITIKLLCRIYRNGYFLKWDESVLQVFCEIFKVRSKELVSKVVLELINTEFFNKKMFSRYEILTSNGIQKRYISACQHMKRKPELHYKFKLFRNNSGIFSEYSTESKLKEKKGNNIKLNKSDSKKINKNSDNDGEELPAGVTKEGRELYRAIYGNK